jgi:hypothetical protein
MILIHIHERHPVQGDYGYATSMRLPNRRWRDVPVIQECLRVLGYQAIVLHDVPRQIAMQFPLLPRHPHRAA